jgi:hypothetical protein
MTSPPPAHRMASTRKPPVSGTSDLFAISVLRSNSPQSDLHTNPARTELGASLQIRCTVKALDKAETPGADLDALRHRAGALEQWPNRRSDQPAQDAEEDHVRPCWR